MKAKIFIMPKQDILDPQGKAIALSLVNLGFSEVKDVRQGKLIEITLDTKDRDHANLMVKQMCEKLLINNIIEEYNFTLSD